MSDTYRKMCSHPLIQGKWKPKVGDEVLDRDSLDIGYVIGTEGKTSPNEIWLPRVEDLLEMLKDEILTIDYFPRLKLPASYRVFCDTREGIFFDGALLVEALLQAIMWTQGFRWTGEGWEER